MKTDFSLLEYNKIISSIANYCKTYIGKNLALSLAPSFSYDNVKYLLGLTTEAINLKIAFGNFSISELPEVEQYLKLLSSSMSLSCRALLNILAHLQLARNLKKYFTSNENSTNSFPLLSNIFSELYVNESIEKNIIDKILDENTIADNASPSLFSLRKKRKLLEKRLKDKLTDMLHSSSFSKYIMEPIITIRDNRYVIPVKEEYRNDVKGFIHDISSSGSTVYIEPLTTFELNNEIQSIKIEEENEVEKILNEISLSLYPYISNIENNIKIIGTLDLIFAKAEYSLDINGSMPAINKNKYINLIKVRHPLINPSSVVPINISIGENYSCLVITGPNTGGKTATLKTVGLSLLMAYSGIYIPCDRGSSIYVFDNIFVDIGDEQSIQESLSTFSSHTLKIKKITESATSNSLILLDELGSGTDPIEGASLAISILDYFFNNKSIIIATTHYPELKNYALITSGFENASCDFDVVNLKPTYNLLIGVPGKSNAFAISKRLGLNESILKNAYNYIDKNTVHMEDILKNIYDDKIKIEKEKNEIEKNLSQIQNLRKSLEEENLKLETQNQEAINEAKLKAKEILLSAKEEANSIIKELNDILNNSPKELKRANLIRNSLDDKIKDTSISSDIEKVNTNLTKQDIKIGMEVFVVPLQKDGIILKLPNRSNEILVQINSAKMNVPIKDLMLTETHKSKQNNSKVTIKKDVDFKAKNISTELNIIGLNIEEAKQVVDKYLDNCILANISTVRIIHGKGTGKLMHGIHEYLKNNKHVKEYRLGTYGEGESGVTIVTLK